MLETLPQGFQQRPPTWDDLKAVSELIKLCDVEEYGSPDITEEDIRSTWSSPRFQMQTDAWQVFTPEGRLAGYAEAEHRHHARLFTYMRIHPDYRALGIDSFLLSEAEAWGQAQIALASPDVRVTLNAGITGVNEQARQLLEKAGYEFTRRHWRMEIDFTEAPAAPEWPEDVTVRTMVVGQDERLVFEMIDEAFSDHYGHMPGVFEDWKHWHLGRKDFDPTLYFLAFEGEKIAGGALCSALDDLGWVGQLAVLRPWRRRGVGLALLQHAFAEFYRRGMHKAGLGVDSQNLTGATRLYYRAGMHIAREYDTYTKELRAGIELSTQTLTV